MADQTEKEPTMEEILASIRRIISEDSQDESVDGDAETESETPDAAAKEPEVSDFDEEDSAQPAQEEPSTTSEPEPESEPLDNQAAVDEIFDLTERVDDPEPEPEPEPEPSLEEDPWDSAQDADAGTETAAPDDDALVSGQTEQTAGATFAELSAMLVGGYEGSGNTLEGLVREMLKPMLRSWLDENLPRIVEDMVEREVTRISSRHGRR